ncbi:hypothetical protein [Aliivibrio wodanis]|uniref:hypothetical protein n=1 Tax=Aliivibrio wodanis TaxID=80852 RepID=UPI00406C234A
MCKLNSLIQPYRKEDLVFNTNKTDKERDKFIEQEFHSELSDVFHNIQTNLFSVLNLANEKGIDAYLKLYGLVNSKETSINTGEFIGLYFAQLNKNRHTVSGSPNVARGGKLLGIDLSKNTINFQLFAYDSNAKIHTALQDSSKEFPQERGALRIKLIAKNVDIINQNLCILHKYLR